MSLLGFLEAGGEAVIRGILSGQSPDYIRSAASGFALPLSEIRSRLDGKGYNRFGYTTPQVNQIISRVAESMDLAARLERGRGLPANPLDVPLAPGAVPGSRVTVGVVVTYRTPTGTADSIVDVVVPNNQVSLPDIIQQATQAVEAQLRPGSPPPYRPSDVGAIVGTRVVTVYRGAPMGT